MTMLRDCKEKKRETEFRRGVRQEAVRSSLVHILLTPVKRVTGSCRGVLEFRTRISRVMSPWVRLRFLSLMVPFHAHPPASLALQEDLPVLSA